MEKLEKIAVKDIRTNPFQPRKVFDQEKLEELAQLDGGNKVPPGLYAQIGLLYGQLGNPGKMAESYQKEMSLFPESTQYINFLLNKGKKVETAQENRANKKAKKGEKK